MIVHVVPFYQDLLICSKADAPGFLENLEELFPRYIISLVGYGMSSSTVWTAGGHH